jgi:hypothetical protein
MYDGDARRLEHLERALEFARQLPADASLSHESAALVAGIPTYDVPAAVRITRTRGRAVRTSDLHVYIAGMRPWDRNTVDGVPITAHARTAVDLGRRLPFGAALVTADGALRAGASKRQMEDVLRHQWTWPRVRHAMPVVRMADRRAESALESWTRSRFITLRLPMPELQANIAGASGWVARSDFLWDQLALVGEADGKIKYLADELWAEKQRQDDIEDTGREVIRWIWRTAHAPDDEFIRRFMRKVQRGLWFKQFQAS